jgi:parallel beta-helix repeat protein
MTQARLNVEKLRYFDLTDEEVTANITSVDWGYPAGDIRRYGAVSGDDCTVAFNTACNLTGSIYVPSGTWTVDPDAITLKSNTRLYGDGWSSKIVLASAGKCIKNVHWGTTTAQDSNIIIENLMIDGGDFSSTAVPTIALKYVKNCLIKNVLVKDAATQAILVAGLLDTGVHYPSEYVTVENCRVDGTNGTGITFFGECKYCKSIGNVVINHEDDAFAFDAETSTACYGNSSIGDTTYNGLENDPAAGGRGLELGGQRQFTCTGFSTRTLASSGIVLEYGTGGSTACDNVVISGFNIYGAGTLDTDADSIGYGINIGRVSGLMLTSGQVVGSQDNGVHVASTAAKVVISDVIAASNGGHGINVTANGTSVSDCRCYSNTTHGIIINNADYCQVYDNVCFDNGSDGIRGADSDYIVISGNHCYDSGAATQDNGIYISNCDRSTVSWNTAHGNVTDQIVPQNFGPSTDSTYITMCGNVRDLGASLKGSATISSGQSNVTVTNANVTLGSVITITPTNATMAAAVAAANGMYVTKINKTSFTCTVTSALGADGTFDYVIM